MSARHKLNGAAFNGTALFAGIIGLTFESWSVFWATVGILAISSVASGSIRLTGRK